MYVLITKFVYHILIVLFILSMVDSDALAVL